MEFIVNGDMWFIELKTQEEMKEMYEKRYPDDDASFVFGVTSKTEHCIYINKNMQPSQQIRTLKHELTHCYIWEYGLYYVPNFSEEMVCDLVSSINEFINKVVSDFIAKGKRRIGGKQ